MRTLPPPGTAWRTLRHLRPRQIAFQVLKRVKPGGSPPPLALAWRRLHPKAGRGKNDSRIRFDGKDRFRFNNEERLFAGNWNDPSARKLWLYNLHYMAWLFDLDSGREEWMLRWIRENPASRGGNGWEPYPLSLRLFHWCKHFLLSGGVPSPEILSSMAGQASRLLSGLEFHLDGNHLLENLLSLAYVGFFLDGTEPAAARARRRIQALLERSLAEQYLEDGGHYELSPMYHAILLERILDLLDAWPDEDDPFPGLRADLDRIARKGLDWLDTMTVGGRFALFNDSAYDTAPEAERLLEFGRSLLAWRRPDPIPLRPLPASGFFRAEKGPFTLLFDGGKLGPDHQMGHAQGDMLSFCLWLRDAPLIVHPGNFEYVRGAMRDYCRSTASHNTLVVENAEQAEWWASHRVGWRGRPDGVTARVAGGTGEILLEGRHDGFARLPGAPVHHRRIGLSEGSLEILDSVSGPERPCRVLFHLHPDCVVESGNETCRIGSPGGNVVFTSSFPMRMEDSWYCPEFGLRIRNRAIVVEGVSGSFKCRFTLAH